MNDAELTEVGVVKVARCTEDWVQTVGEGRVRRCGRCANRVYDFAGLGSDEARLLLRRAEPERTCARLFLRSDGAVLTRNCSARPRRLGLVVRIFAAAALVLVGLLTVVTLLGDNIRRHFQMSSGGCHLTGVPAGDSLRHRPRLAGVRRSQHLLDQPPHSGSSGRSWSIP